MSAAFCIDMDDNDLKGRFDNIDARFDKVDTRFDEVGARFTEADARFNEMRQIILEEGRRTRTHFDVVAEGLKDQIKVICEGHAALTER